MQICTAGDNLASVIQNFLVDVEVLCWVEAQNFLETCNFFGTQLRTVDTTGVLLGWCWPADHGAQGDDRWAGSFGLGGTDGLVQCLEVFDVFAGDGPINTLGVPAVGIVATQYIFGEGDVGVVFDGDLVVIVDYDKVAQFLVTSQRGGFGGDAFLQVTIGSDDIYGVIEWAAGSSRPRMRRWE